ncbi:MaoC/PaaZ C-terminal domain-containing protein [Nocardia australiensis]|uniref:MaoC/PaaZ C-terminal domain-containing protein n=1 Tax=Nocardia australiensis TaxID=2887191 RepID=UPI001D137C9C|nr:MaoC/PaaZ C-terminal domain-containing protein [Nocardia australiensis]
MTAADIQLRYGDISIGAEVPRLEYRVTATTVVLGALASRDWRPMHHDHHFAVQRNGTRDIFMNTPNQAAWFERYLTDWTGPRGRLGRLAFRMISPVYPDTTMVLRAVVTATEVDHTGCGWAVLELGLSTDGELSTRGNARIAVPRDASDNPWRRTGRRWNP